RENLDRVGAIFEDVRRDGDAALVRALERFDGVSITPGEISIAPEEVEEARRTVPRQVQDAVATAIDAVRRYNERLLQGSSWLEGVEVAGLYGPSEGLILADDSADPRILAADYLNEAEHGHDSAAILVTPSRPLVEAVQREVEAQLAALPEPRRSYAASATSKY